MRVTVVHNADAGYLSLSKGQLIRLVNEAGYEVDYWPISAGSAEAVRAAEDLVVVAGGDGTVRKIAIEMVGCDVPIAVLPLGTANNIARALGWEGEPADIIPRWRTAKCTPLDAGVAIGPWGSTYFFEAAGLGLFAEVMPELSIHKKQENPAFDGPSEELRYDADAIRGALAHASTCYLQIELDGEKLSGEYLLVEAMNIPTLGPGLRLAPNANPCDGLIDVLIVSSKERKIFEEYLSRQPEGEDLTGLEVRRGRRLEIAWSGGTMHVDDRVWPETSEWEQWVNEAPHDVVFTVHPNAVQFLLP